MLKKINNIQELEKIFNEAIKEKAQSVCVEVTIPFQRDTEFIINKNKSIRNKLNYYKKIYGEDLVHTKNEHIKIVAAGYGDADLWEE